MTGRLKTDLVVADGMFSRWMPTILNSCAAPLRSRPGASLPVGAHADIAAAFEARETLDASGCAVLPGLVDAYAHAGMGSSVG